MNRPTPGAARDRVVCVGNAGVDRTFAVGGPVRLATSNPAHLRTGFGGVARNVAENLARLDVAVSLVTQVGDDPAGRALRADCAASGIDVRGVLLSPAHATSEYTAIIDARGELVIGASATAAIDALTIVMLGAAFDDDARTAWTFADCTLPAAVIGALLEDRRAGGPPLAIDGVSDAKVRRLPADLRGLDLLFLNAGEARAVLDDAAVEEEAAAQRLLERGVAAVVVTRGSAPIVVAGPDGIAEVTVPRAVPVDVTGAGDALVAGTLFGLTCGEALHGAVRTGSYAAKLTIESPSASSRTLTRAALAALRATA